MGRLEDLVRDALVASSDDTPDDATLLTVVRRQAARRQRRRRLAAVLGAAIALVAGGIASDELLAPQDNSATMGSSNSSPEPADSAGLVPLLSSGECAGLSVTAVLPGHPTRWRIAPGSDANLVTMPGNALMWLEAQGPCFARLRFHTDGSLLQGPDPRADGTFNADGIGVIVSHANAAGRSRIELYLDCSGSAGCQTASPPLAVIAVDVTAPVAAPTTLEPRSGP